MEAPVFSLTDIFETFTQAFGGGQVADAAGQMLQGGSITDVLSNAGVDPSLLDGVTGDELLGLLANAGIDPSALTDGQLGELTQLIGGGGDLGDLAARATSIFTDRSA
jgi:hypothetical protein